MGLLERAARQGDDRARYLLAVKHLRSGDAAGAIPLLGEAATGGVPEAAYDLGVCYLRGEGTDRDPRMAWLCFLDAAIRGFAPARSQVAAMAENGEGTPRDRAVAELWREVATARGRG